MSCRSGCQCNSNGDAAKDINAVAPALLSVGAGKCVGTSKGIALAQLGLMLDYPDEDFFAKLERLASSIRTAYPNSAKPLKKFQDHCKDMTRADMEELYTRTFDLAAIASPYITGYIYGDENFDRGTLMATLSENYARLGFDMEGELPDHLALMLRFSSWLDEESLDELINYCLQKPVKEMCEQLRNCDSPYFFLLSAIDTVLHSAQTGESKS